MSGMVDQCQIKLFLPLNQQINSNMKQHYQLIPREAFLLFPKDKDVYFEQKGVAKRIIYGDGTYPQYTQKERQKIQQFRQYIQKDPISKEIKETDQMLLLKMIYANKYNFENSLANLKAYKEWQTQFVPVQSIDPEYRRKMDNLLKTGVFYASPTRDQYFKPMIIVHVGRLLRVKPEQKFFLDTFGYFLQSAIDQMMIDGQVQTWNVIVDVDQTSVFSFAGVLFELIKFLSRIFIGRMYRCYIVDYPFLIKFVWGTVSLMMDAEQNEKCRILTKQEMVKLIPKQALQQKYGGDLPALKDFWPLNTPQRLRIQKQSQQSMSKYWTLSNTLISQHEYFSRYQLGKIGVKKCWQILSKFTTKQQQSSVSQQKGPVKQILSPKEAIKMNSIIQVEHQPCSIKIVDECQEGEIRVSGDRTRSGKSQDGGGDYDAKRIQKTSSCFYIRKNIFKRFSFFS